MNSKKLFQNLIGSNLNIPEDDVNFKKVHLINFILIIGIPVNASFIYINYLTGQFLFSLANIFIVLIMSITFFYLRRSQTHIGVASHATIIGMFFIHLPALFQGGIANSGFLWFFLFPLFSIFLTGLYAGRIWIAALLSSIIVVFLFSSHLSLPYEPIYLIFLFIALILESIFVLFLESIHSYYEKQLSLKNDKLERLTHHLQDEVKSQVQVIRNKDNLLTQQSKMASVGEMMSNISHQWKQPLSTINVLVHNINLAQDFEDENMEELMQFGLINILHQTDLMERTMKDFLNFSRPETGNKNFSINHAVKIMMMLVESSFQALNIKLMLLPFDKEIKLHGKENEFVHAIMNIVNNAKDALVEHHINEPEVTLTLFQDENRSTLSICDNAGGIDQEIIPKIFDPYFSTRQDSGGTGLGLNLSSKIIQESFHGSIEVLNKDSGVCFILGFKR